MMKLLKTGEDGECEKGTTLIMGGSILLELREHEMYHRRSLKVRYFPGAKIADMKTPKLKKMHIGTNGPPFSTQGNMFQELKELWDFTLKFLPDVKLIFSTPVIRTDKSKTNENNKQFINCLEKPTLDCMHHTNITVDHLNAYDLHINGHGTRVLSKNLISGAVQFDMKRIL